MYSEERLRAHRRHVTPTVRCQTGPDSRPRIQAAVMGMTSSKCATLAHSSTLGHESWDEHAATTSQPDPGPERHIPTRTASRRVRGATWGACTAPCPRRWQQRTGTRRAPAFFPAEVQQSDVSGLRASGLGLRAWGFPPGSGLRSLVVDGLGHKSAECTCSRLERVGERRSEQVKLARALMHTSSMHGMVSALTVLCVTGLRGGGVCRSAAPLSHRVEHC